MPAPQWYPAATSGQLGIVEHESPVQYPLESCGVAGVAANMNTLSPIRITSGLHVGHMQHGGRFRLDLLTTAIVAGRGGYVRVPG